MIRPLLAVAVLLAPTATQADDDQPLAGYFAAEVERITAEPLLGITDLETWEARRPGLQDRLRSMLGLDPMPEKTDLKVEIRGIVERPDFVVERILYQSSPGLYVTANLYLPKEADEPVPAVLYVCGHANVVRDGVIYGSKAHYQKHAAWYAANGIACLVVDTLQLGEVPGLHHGTYREGKWWWQSRGYTPTGIEVWNGIRAIDYLQSRPEINPEKIGVTGRSGGGAISWYLGAVDDRLAAVIPVAGITDLSDHLLKGGPTGSHPNGVIEGHCDCMYLVNTDAWDFDTLAALVAPKAMLVENTNADPIFPEPGVRRIYEQLEKVYAWYDTSDRVGFVIGEGGHVDSEEIRHPSFAFMNTWLKGDPTDLADIVEPDRSIPVELLKVLDVDEPIPSDALNDRIDETFVPLAEAEATPIPDDAEAWERLRSSWLDQVRREVFGGWPEGGEAAPPSTELSHAAEVDGVVVRQIAFESQPGVTLDLWMLDENELGDDNPERIALLVMPNELASPLLARLNGWITGEDPELEPMTPAELLHHARIIAGEDDPSVPIVYLFPRGTGPSAWSDAKDTHIRRRFALIGQTLDGMRVWDVRRAIAALRTLPSLADVPVHLTGARSEAPLATWAAVFEPSVAHVRLRAFPGSFRDGPTFLNFDRLMTSSQALSLLYPRPVTVDREIDPAAYQWAADLAEALDHDEPWPSLVD